MKTSILTLASIALCLSIAATGCEQSKQMSQQPEKNSNMTDARHDLAQQPSAVGEASNGTKALNANANSADVQKSVTTNPNSSRNTTDSTINTSAGAAVVGNANMNPRDYSANAQTPTSIDNIAGTEPMVNEAVNAVDCRDAIANDYNGKASPKKSTCAPTGRSPLAR
ncbi:MAG: hypothetical protein H7249_07245 [Chitinophagaceae bacterium]|nr:hypothetical protein [Oligoflexus sp.]